ncbi:MAG: pirin family protein [bacterium]
MEKENFRKIKKIIRGQSAIDGAGVKLVRIFGNDDTKDFDPFLMLDAFDSRKYEDYIKGFPWHPHRGIETITYLIEGVIEHGDSLGSHGTIASGDCQWMTAGSGIIHQEMPQKSERLFGVQLWLNLPAKSKMTPPQYRDIKAEKIPSILEDGVTIKIVSGDYKQNVGAIVADYAQVTYLDVEIESGKKWLFESDSVNTLFVYVLQGAGRFEGNESDLVFEKHAVLFGDGERLNVQAAKSGLRFLLISGKPLKESIAWGGPIVMNTADELNRAFRELDEGTFIK